MQFPHKTSRSRVITAAPLAVTRYSASGSWHKTCESSLKMRPVAGTIRTPRRAAAEMARRVAGEMVFCSQSSVPSRSAAIILIGKNSSPF